LFLLYASVRVFLTEKAAEEVVIVESADKLKNRQLKLWRLILSFLIFSQLIIAYGFAVARFSLLMNLNTAVTIMMPKAMVKALITVFSPFIAAS
jgi:hypothetical protein